MPAYTDFPATLDLAVRLIQSQAGIKMQPGQAWLNDAQVLSLKLFRHLVSMRLIASGESLKIDDLPTIPFVDHASIKVVARAAFEPYLVFFFHYGNADQSLSEFRWKIWKLGGLMDRQQFHSIYPEHRAIQAEEKKSIDRLKAEITASPHFQSYTYKQGPKLLKGDWRIGNAWSDLGVNAGFHEKFFKNIYSYLCGYSHSSYLSALQVGQALSIEEQQMLTHSTLDIAVVIASHFAFTYCKIFPKAESVLTKNQVAAAIAKKWRFGPESMDKFYGA